ncbi:helix-turn-helix domain-containing protein [Ferruginibacter profundus]
MQAVTITQISAPELETLIENSLKRILKFQKQEQLTQTDFWFDLTELCNYLPDKPAKPTVYGWVHACLIPHHKGGKKLRFLKSEIDTWLKLGKKKTISELAVETDQYLSKKKGG